MAAVGALGACCLLGFCSCVCSRCAWIWSSLALGLGHARLDEEEADQQTPAKNQKAPCVVSPSFIFEKAICGSVAGGSKCIMQRKPYLERACYFSRYFPFPFLPP
jgi:hypothetical protein